MAFPLVHPPFGGALVVPEVVETPKVTVALPVAMLPSESITWMMSVTPPVGPAV